MNNKSSIENSQSKIPDLWSGAQFTQINIVSQNTAKQFFFSYQPETTKKELRKINSFLQNKPNSPKSQINVNKVLTRDYENVHLTPRPKTNPIKPNSKPISPKTKPISPETNPIKPNANSQIPTGKLQRISKPGTNFEGKKMQFDKTNETRLISALITQLAKQVIV